APLERVAPDRLLQSSWRLLTSCGRDFNGAAAWTTKSPSALARERCRLRAAYRRWRSSEDLDVTHSAAQATFPVVSDLRSATPGPIRGDPSDGRSASAPDVAAPYR